MSAPRTANARLNARRAHATVVKRSIYSAIVDEKRTPSLAINFDEDRPLNEVGRKTPPVRILRPGPDGTLREAEIVPATAFRLRREKSRGGSGGFRLG